MIKMKKSKYTGKTYQVILGIFVSQPNVTINQYSSEILKHKELEGLKVNTIISYIKKFEREGLLSAEYITINKSNILNGYYYDEKVNGEAMRQHYKSLVEA